MTAHPLTPRDEATVPQAPTSPCKGEVAAKGGGRGSSRFSHKPEMTERARRLRYNPTDVERKLWQRLRRDQLNGLNFRRQHPVGPYVLDFYCPAIRLAIELDGGQHTFDRQRRHDERRTRWLEASGIRLIRFWNNDVTGNLSGVLESIALIASELTPSPTLPLSGGGRRESSPSGIKGISDLRSKEAATAPRVPTSPCKGEVAAEGGGRGSRFVRAARREP